VHWAKRYVLDHNKRHLAEMGVAEIEVFLTYRARDRWTSPSAKNSQNILSTPPPLRDFGLTPVIERMELVS
ncbi:MAG: hypothetical protein RMJ46_00205, partial [Bacteroidota bacterium]|nr:hypothetical protein [Bacteroidota bacterium]